MIFAGRADTVFVLAVSLSACVCQSPDAGPRDAGQACVPEPERCDGIDNDCDGLSDLAPDGGRLNRLCQQQLGVCAGAFVECVWGAFPQCGPISMGPDWEAQETRCDGLDNDCNGAIDVTSDGGPIIASCRLDTGLCAGRHATCRGGVLPECGAAEYGPSWENVESRCDSIDNDCDGVADQSRWVTSRAGYSLFSFSATDYFPWLFPAAGGYLAQYGPLIWRYDHDLAAQPATWVPSPNGASDFPYLPSALPLGDEFVAMPFLSQQQRPTENFAWRFGLDGRVRSGPDGGVDYWHLGLAPPGLFTLTSQCASGDGETLLAGTIPKSTGPLYVMSIARDGGVLTAGTLWRPSTDWTCAPLGASGFVIATTANGATSLTQVDRFLAPRGEPRGLTGSCAVERLDERVDATAIALCKDPATLVRNLFDGGEPQSFSPPSRSTRLVRTPAETLIAADVALMSRFHELSLASPSTGVFRVVQRAPSDSRIAVQGGEPGTVILMTEDVSMGTFSLSRLCYP